MRLDSEKRNKTDIFGWRVQNAWPCVLTGDAKNKILGPSGPPLMHVGVNKPTLSIVDLFSHVHWHSLYLLES